jgi:hypothetical protein
MNITNNILQNKKFDLKVNDFFIVTFGENKSLYFGLDCANKNNIIIRAYQGQKGLYVQSKNNKYELFNCNPKTQYDYFFNNDKVIINTYQSLFVYGTDEKTQYKFIVENNGWSIKSLINNTDENNKKIRVFPYIEITKIHLKNMDRVNILENNTSVDIVDEIVSEIDNNVFSMIDKKIENEKEKRNEINRTVNKIVADIVDNSLKEISNKKKQEPYDQKICRIMNENEQLRLLWSSMKIPGIN